MTAGNGVVPVWGWSPPAAAGAGRGAHVEPRHLLHTFIVEDSAIILENLIATLEELASVHVIGHAADEAAAVQQLAQLGDEVDLVIVDVFLRAGSGLGVLRRARLGGTTAPCVVLTNYATADMREKCSALGADRVFDKSNDLDELIGYCTRLAGGSTTPPDALN
jgi:DNA-binding NarL/FixJ family response regulator